MAGTMTRDETDLRPYVPRLAATLDDGPIPRRVVVDGSLAFVDISGFTALSERLASRGRVGAEIITGAMTTTFTALLDTAAAYGGDLLKFGGDALLLLFDDRDHALRAAAAVAGMQARLADVGRIDLDGDAVALGMSAGIASGSVELLVVGRSHLEIVVAGGVADSVARTEAATGRGATGLSSATVAALPRSWVSSTADGAFELRHEAAVASPREAATAPSGDMSRFVPSGLRADLGRSVGEHRTACIGFGKVTGLTESLATDPDGTVARLHAAVVAVTEEVERHGACFLATDLTDGGVKMILAAGVPATRGGDEERMMRLARSVIARDVPLPIRFGLNAGHLFAGDVGAPFRRTFTVMGDTVNLAARLVERATPGTVLAPQSLLRRTRSRFTYRPLPSFAVKGKVDAIHAAEVGDPLPEQTGAGHDVPLVGRETERDLLVAALHDAGRGRSTIHELTADAGLGKSRLVADAVAAVPEVRTYVVACDEYSADQPYISVRRLVRAVLDIAQDADRTEAGIGLLRAVDSDLRPWAPLLALAVGAEVAPTREVTSLDPAFVPERLGWAVSELLMRRLVDPSHVLFEDAHWMDDASAGVIRYTLERGADRPWAITVTRRPGPPGFHVPEAVDPVRLRLEPLGPAEVIRLVEVAAGEGGMLPDLAATIAARSEGHPMMLLELARAAAAGGEDLPTSIEALVTQRIDRAEPADRHLLRAVSVLGRRFPRALTDEVTEPGVQLTEDVWERLAEYVEPVGSSDMQFRHALVREAAYSGLPFGMRRRLHARVASAIERRVAHPEDEAGLLSLHHSLAGDHRAAWRYATIAGDRAAADHASADAVALYRRALDSAGRVREIDRRDVGRVAERLGDAADLAGRFDEAMAAFRRASSLDGREHARARLMWKRGLAYERVGKYPQALRCLRRAMTIAEASEDESVELLRGSVAVAYAGVRFRQARYRDCIAWCDDALGLVSRESQPKEWAHATYLRSHAASFLGHDTGDAALEAVEIFQGLGEGVMAANVLNNLGIEAYNRGQWVEAAEFQRRHEETRRASGDLMGAAIAAYNRGLILLDQGRDEQARSAFETVRSVAAAAGHVIAEHAAHACLGTLASRRGDHDDAGLHLDQAVSTFREIGASYFVFDALMRRAEAVLLRGDPQGAISEVDASLAEATGHEGIEASVVGLRRIRCSALLVTGRASEARREALDVLAEARSGHMLLEELLLLEMLDEDAPRRRELVRSLGISLSTPFHTREVRRST